MLIHHKETHHKAGLAVGERPQYSLDNHNVDRLMDKGMCHLAIP